MKLTHEQKIKVLEALEDCKIRYGKIVWEITIQDGRIIAIRKIGQEEIEKII